MQPISCSFNGYVLQNAYFRSNTIQHTDIPLRDLQMEPRARADGYTIVNAKFTTKQIEIDGQLSAADRASLVAKIDEMKLNLNGVSGNLDIDWGAGSRRYYGTVSKLEIPEQFYNINAVPYKIIFSCANPFGYTTTSGGFTLRGVTNMLEDVIITLSGSINADPSVLLTVNAGTVGMNLVTFSNQDTGEVIIITKPNAADFATNDLLVINCANKTVQINGSGLDYTGRFPTMNPPTATLRMAIQATSVNYDYTVNYLPTYL